MDNYETSHLQYIEAKIAYEEKRYEDAVLLLRQSASLHAHFKTYELIGQSLIEMNDYKNAQEALENAYQLNSRSNKTAVLLAQCLIKSGDAERAKKILNDTLDRNSSYSPASSLLSKL